MPPLSIQQALDRGMQCHRAGRLAEAEAIYRQILGVDPHHADALHLLGVIAYQVGRHEVAVELISKALERQPNWAEANNNLGNAWQALGQFERAIASFQQAVRFKPDYAEAYSNLGSAWRDKGDPDEALAACQRAIALKPEHVEAHNNLGNAWRGKGELEKAIACYRQALALRGDYAEAGRNLAITLREAGKLDEAAEAWRQVVSLRPTDAEAFNHLGNVLREQLHLEEAAQAYRQCLALEPSRAEAHGNLGAALSLQGEIEESIVELRRAIELKPELREVHSSLLMSQHYLPGGDPESLFREHTRWNEIHAQPLAGDIPHHGNERDPAKRLRVGYVSADFREHSVAYFIESLLAAHDPTQVEVFCYASVARPDAVTERLKQLVTNWRDIVHLSDADAAELIAADHVDILVDLSGHTAKNRLAIFAHKPAPVQVTWLGYPDTTGMESIDYRFTDALADPPGMTDRWNRERLIRLPDCAWGYRPSEYAPPVSPSPILRAGTITFGCFNSRSKITPELLRTWCEILHAAPGSRLLLKNLAFYDPATRRRTQVLLESFGLAPERVELASYTPGLADHLASYGRVDIALDTFPYHGTATTCEALWMGVPVITQAGQMHASRVGVSLLTNVGLLECIAPDSSEYVRLATVLAGDLDHLATIRKGLRERMAASPLMDASRLARAVEGAYRTMWRAWCDGSTAQS